MSALDYLIYALAAWRLAYMLVKEQGPFNVFGRLRRRIGIEQIVVNGAQGAEIAWVAANTVAEALMCVWCTSVWCAAFLVLGSLLPVIDIVILWLARIMAISAGAIIVHEGVNRWRGVF